jgi:hypothetical protein
MNKLILVCALAVAVLLGFALAVGSTIGQGFISAQAQTFVTGFGLLTVTSATPTCGGSTSVPCVQVNSAVFPRLQSIVSPAPSSPNAGTTAFDGVGNPTWQDYTTNPFFLFTPDTNCTGQSDTLNVDKVGALPLEIETNGVIGPSQMNSCFSGVPILVVAVPDESPGNVGGASGFLLYPP